MSNNGEWVRTMDDELGEPYYYLDDDGSDLVIQRLGHAKYQLWTFDNSIEFEEGLPTNAYYKPVSGTFSRLNAAKAAYMMMFESYMEVD